ncbi:hypothetical protein RD792_006511 [Penstemon davidsonii]|uniref:Uncharacterized protein n=1 Tax=Penstemon davidsonii TaxID=160366 RepID=A0ABR0DD77_9LAMI|nr:hypothetical protein RD792_006511 [Penstemon davidsonii]
MATQALVSSSSICSSAEAARKIVVGRRQIQSNSKKTSFVVRATSPVKQGANRPLWFASKQSLSYLDGRKQFMKLESKLDNFQTDGNNISVPLNSLTGKVVGNKFRGEKCNNNNWKLIMASQSRIPPPHLQRPLPGPGVMHPDPYGSATCPSPGGFPHFEMLPPPVVMEQKLSAQHIEIEKLATENQRLANTHGTIRHDLATANNELQATYDYEKKLYNDHLESLQVMEKNYMAMSREVEKLRAKLTNTANFDPRTGPERTICWIAMGNYASGQNAYAVGQQGQTPLVGVGSGGRSAGAGTSGAASTKVNSPQVLAQSAPASSGAVPDTSRGPGHSAPRGPGYDAKKGHTGAGYDPQRVTGPSYNAQMGHTGPMMPRGD